MGQSVIVEGAWANEPAVLVPGRAVDGVPATLLVRALTVAADATGTGSPATLAVVAGWVPEGSEPAVADLRLEADAPLTVRGYLRGSEAPGNAAWPTDSPEGAVWVPTLSTALFAQLWPSPVYSAIVVDDQAAAGWNTLPLPPQESSLDIRSLTYAFEWWLFGAFAVFVVVRWIRDNGRSSQVEAPGEDHQ
jgi:cytochrome oxidase assembly protein ShyY1